MEIFKVVALAIIQGITEFIPVSSTGHLIIFSDLLNTNLNPENTSALIIFLHIGTLIALFIYYRVKLIAMLKDAFNSNGTLLKILLASIPAFIFGIFFSKVLEPNIFGKHQYIFSAIELILTGTLFIFIENLTRNIKKISTSELSIKQSFIIGLFQAFGIFYGVSRSGITLVGVKLVGLKKGDDVDFTFLLSIPAIIGAIVYTFVDNSMASSSTISLEVIIVGTIVSAIAGYIAIDLLVKFLKKYSLRIFGIYCVLFGILALLIKVIN